MDKYEFHDMTFTWLEGVMFNTDGGTLFGPVPRAVWGRFFPYNEANQIPCATDPILIQYQGKNYLIDTSIDTGKMNDKMKRNAGVITDGNVVGSLAELDLSPEDIDVVMMTHMHSDHASGLTYLEDGELKSRFPNAVIYMSQIEWDEVRNPNMRTRNTYLKMNWEAVQDQVKTFDEKLEVAPGITMELTGGHSRGHAIVRFEQKGETMLHLADILLTFAHSNPLWVGGVDDYPMDSIAAKQKLLTEAFENNHRILFYHDPFYRVVEYTEDGKNFNYVMPVSKDSPIPLTDQQDKAHTVVE